MGRESTRRRESQRASVRVHSVSRVECQSASSQVHCVCTVERCSYVRPAGGRDPEVNLEPAENRLRATAGVISSPHSTHHCGVACRGKSAMSGAAALSEPFFSGSLVREKIHTMDALLYGSDCMHRSHSRGLYRPSLLCRGPGRLRRPIFSSCTFLFH